MLVERVRKLIRLGRFIFREETIKESRVDTGIVDAEQFNGSLDRQANK